MEEADDLILGEFPRQLDERFRVSIPQEWVQPLVEADGFCTLAKERPGCLSLWNTRRSQDELDAGMALVRGKFRAGKHQCGTRRCQNLSGRVDTPLLHLGHQHLPETGRGRIASCAVQIGNQSDRLDLHRMPPEGTRDISQQDDLVEYFFE